MSTFRIPWPGLAAFFLSAALTWFLYSNALKAERENTRLDFSQAAAIRINALRNEMRDTIELLQLASRHLELVDGGSLKGFQHYIEPMLEQHPYLQSVGYNPRILLAERAAFEKKARQDVADFTILDAMQPGVFQAAAERTEYYPFLYAEPMADNLRAVGFDVAIEPLPNPDFPRRTAIAAAIASNSLAVTTPLTLVLKKSSGKIGVIVFSPLYQGGMHDKERLFGFATLVIRVGDMVTWSQRRAADAGWKDVDIVLEDISGPTSRPLHGKVPEVLPELSYADTIELPGNRHWRVVALPVSDSFSLAPGTGALTLMTAGLILSLLLGALVQVLADKAETIRRQVANRTADLAAANGKLTEEVTLRMASEERVRQISVLQKSVLANASDAIIATDAEGIIQVFNPAAERMLGYTAKEVVNQLRPTVFHDKAHTQDKDDVRFQAIVAPLDLLSPGTPFDQEINYWTKAGTAVPVVLSHSLMLDDQGKRVGYLSIAYDISSQKAAQERITRLANYDTLTSLPNRLQLRKELRRSIAAAKRSRQQLGLMFVDLHRFKNINDSLGHSVGDILLRTMADRLQACLRDGDMVARMGGDEFVILLNALERPDDAAEVADRVLALVSTPVHIDDHTLTVTPSIGIALYPEDGEDSDSLIQNADTAMYSAKEQGRNRYRFFTRSMNERVSTRLIMESRIRDALKEERFLLYYQPQYDAASGQLIGAEALVRMTSDDGLVAPDSFIPVAEDSGLILPLGDWVLNEAARRNRAWIDAGLNPVPIAVNVSARQFEQPDFHEKVRNTLQQTGLDPHWLEIELTESTIMQSVDKAFEALKALKEQGLRIAIDDFGTGFSSLAYLKRFPIDRLKIDKSFVDDLKPGTEGNSIVQAIIGMAHQLNLDVIAEGVETEEQAELLRRWNCNAFQGYLLGRPMTAESFQALLKP